MRFKEFMNCLILLTILFAFLVGVFALQVASLSLVNISKWFWLLAVPCISLGFYAQYRIMNALKRLFR